MAHGWAAGCVPALVALAIAAGDAAAGQARSEYIAFTSRRDLSFNVLEDIFLIEPDGTDELQLVVSAEKEWQTAVSPDGSQILYARSCCGDTEIHSGGPQGGGGAPLFSGAGVHTAPAWSRDGNRIAFASNTHDPGNVSDFEVYVDGVKVTNATGSASMPAFSRFGTHIAYVASDSQGTGLYVAGIDGSSPDLIVAGTVGNPDWSPATDRIAYTCGFKLCIVDSDGGNNAQIPTTGLAFARHPSWSPDGKRIAFEGIEIDSDDGWEIYTMLPTGGDRRQLTHNEYDDTEPSWGGIPIVSAEVELTLGAARMTIPDWRGEEEHEFEIDPPVLTLYGRTVVPVTVRLLEEDGETPVEGQGVTLRVQPQGADVGPQFFGFSTDPDGAGPDEVALVTDSNGEAATFLHVEHLYQNVLEGDDNATAFTITAEHGDDVPAEATVEVQDNRESLIQEYSVAGDYIPQGARSIWRDAFLPPLRGPVADLPGAMLGAIVQPGNTGRGTVLCNTYQSRTLLFFNDIRHSDDGWLLNGLHYSPVQTLHTEHHFVSLYPNNTEYDDSRARIFDPWLPQTAAVYTWLEFVNFVDTISQGTNVVPDISMNEKNPGTCVVQCGLGNFVPPPYPAAGGHYPWFPENDTLPITPSVGLPGKYDGCLSIPPDYCQRNGFGGQARSLASTVEDHGTVVIGSPVKFLVTTADGKHVGFDPENPDQLTDDFDDEYTSAFMAVPEPEDEVGWYIEVPPADEFTIKLLGEQDGTADVVVAGADGKIWGGYLDIPIAEGASVDIEVDLGASCGELDLEGDQDIPCVQELAGQSCGNPSGDRAITAVDSLFTLRAAVGSASCSLLVCDVNDDAKITASDALLVLKRAVGSDVPLRCRLAGQ